MQQHNSQAHSALLLYIAYICGYLSALLSEDDGHRPSLVKFINEPTHDNMWEISADHHETLHEYHMHHDAVGCNTENPDERDLYLIKRHELTNAQLKERYLLFSEICALFDNSLKNEKDYVNFRSQIENRFQEITRLLKERRQLDLSNDRGEI